MGEPPTQLLSFKNKSYQEENVFCLFRNIFYKNSVILSKQALLGRITRQSILGSGGMMTN